MNRRGVCPDTAPDGKDHAPHIAIELLVQEGAVSFACRVFAFPDVEIGPREDENLFAESDLYMIAEELDFTGAVPYGASNKVRIVPPGQ